MNQTAIAGNSGPKVRSDCEVTLELRTGGGITIELVSRVEALYGESIRNLAAGVLSFFGVNDARVSIIDSGALPYVIMARIEAAVKQLIETELEYLPPVLPENVCRTEKDRFRFSRLYIPGNSPGLMINAGLHMAEGIILDLEDSVAPEKKDEARYLVRNALRQVSFHAAERMVRINQGERGLEDLRYVIPHYVNLILLPKCEDPDQVKKVEAEIDTLKRKNNIDIPVYLMPVIETALGVERAFDIARASGEVVAIAIGLEDYTADLGVARTAVGSESLYARTRLVVAARAAGIQPIDSVFSDVGDMDALAANVKISRELGFAGMGCIHPRQVKVIRDGFMPGPEEIERCCRIVEAFEEAKKKGQGVVALGTKMIDPPVVARAQKTIELASRLGLLPGAGKEKIN